MTVLKGLNLTSSFSIWLGLGDLDVESVFRTTEGFTASWMNWYPGEPNGNAGHSHGLEDCVIRCSSSEKWNDDACSLLKKFYCETKSKPSIEPNPNKVY